MSFTGGFWVTLGVLVMLVCFLYVTDPKHRHVRRVLSPPFTLLVGLCVRIGLID